MDKKGVLVVDDEALAVKYFSKAFKDRFSVYSATSAEEALDVLDSYRDEIGVIVTDQRMPGSSGVELLKEVRNRFPHTVRILTTAYSEWDTLIEAIDVGAVYSFISKPWKLEDLEQKLVKALDFHESQVQNFQLLDKKYYELKSQFLEDRAYDAGLISAKIGHYVHNALCPLAFLVDQLLDKKQENPNLPMDFLESVRVHIYDVARTLKDLEEVSVPLNEEKYKPLNVEAMLDKALEKTEFIRNERNLCVEKLVMDKLPRIKGVPEQIEQLFRFMISEEVVSLPKKSRVVLRLSSRKVDKKVVGVNIEFEDFVPISPKISPESLLQPFNLRGSNPREFGLFLVSCYFIARHHGGSLVARTKDDQGLAFSLSLPCDPHNVEDGAERKVEKNPIRHTNRR